MGNKQMANAGTATATRTFSTTSPPSASSVAHHRLNRRRSDFQQNSKRSAEQMKGERHKNNFGTLSNGAELPMNLVAERTRQRRRCSSAALVAARNNAIQKPKRITPRQCHLVIKSWNKRSPKNRMAKDIFAAIFVEAEELKTAFGIDVGSAGKRLRTEPNFVAHTNMFTDTLDFVIRNLDDLSLVTENAEQLGRRHAAFPLEAGFRTEYWNMFTECICEGVCGAEEDKESSIAWRLLVQTIVYHMKLGYDRETLRIQRHSSFRRSASPLVTPREASEPMEKNSTKNEQKNATPQQMMGIAMGEFSEGNGEKRKCQENGLILTNHF